jgi:tripartite-type tricarboxylate transporter receptor subunit TctC
LFAPKGLPPDIQSLLNRALIETSADATTRKRLLDIGAELPGAGELTPQALHDLVEREVGRWSAVLKDAGVK